MKTNTKLLHDYPVIDAYTGASSIPKYQTSTFHQQKLYDDSQQFSYTRFGNPTVHALEEALASFENARYALAYSSGMAAISNVLMLVKAGEHIILPTEVYGGTCQFVNEVLPNFHIETTFVDFADLHAVEAAIQPNTAMLYLETPSNPLLKISDIEAIVALAKKHEILTAADNTFMTALYQSPLGYGVDIVVESVTKFINGHSDVVAGLAATNDEVLYEKLKLYQKNFGAILGVEDAWLVLRGMKTMGLRMERSIENAKKIAQFLVQHPQVKKVYYPTLAHHEGQAIHMKQAQNGGAVLSFELHTKEDLIRFTERVQLPILAVSLGGVESILSHPATMSHACLPAHERLNQGICDELLRLSCGIEDIEDLLEDLAQALQ